MGEGLTYKSVTDKITDIVLKLKTSKGWWIGFGLSFTVLQVLVVSIVYLLIKGPGIWGVNNPVMWGFAIINFVWWIGIGHAGTLISAILLLVQQDWRTSINRFAEAMTVFAVMCAGLFPLLHVGRPWLAYWMLPYPSTMGVWPQFRSPLLWDVFAISTYLTVSVLFWYLGLIPDMATLRDRATHKVKKAVYGFLSLGWRGAAKHWDRFTTAYLILAGLSTPLVLSVHSIVSFDFAVSNLPGWHTTIFPPYFVAGAVYSGFAMVLTVLIPVRHIFGLHDVLTLRHLNSMSKVMLAMGLVVAYGYSMEAFYAFYSGAQYEIQAFQNRMYAGPYAWSYWALILCNVAIPQLLWFRRFRTTLVPLWMISIVINIGMWLERYVIVITLNRDFLTSSWDFYSPTIWDWSLYLGTFGLFFTCTFLFIRFLPMINVFEMRELIHHVSHHHHVEGGHGADSHEKSVAQS
ncbi:MAG: polysulfide reductase NrfD [Ignavibacteriae bacterium]|nr:polysulfide reductase NrfD [Ignavibacteriota bacterium]MCB9216189.1 polysulfide reductase NrfD [Ignavibacteria bacterium]